MSARNGWMPLRAVVASAAHSYFKQLLPSHRKHLRAWRFATLDTQTPLRRVMPGPHAAAICVMMLSGALTGATGVACAGTAIATMKATATILIMFSSQGWAKNDGASDASRHPRGYAFVKRSIDGRWSNAFTSGIRVGNGVSMSSLVFASRANATGIPTSGALARS